VKSFDTAAAKLSLTQSSRQTISDADKKKEDEYIESELAKNEYLRNTYD